MLMYSIALTVASTFLFQTVLYLDVGFINRNMLPSHVQGIEMITFIIYKEHVCFFFYFILEVKYKNQFVCTNNGTCMKLCLISFLCIYFGMSDDCVLFNLSSTCVPIVHINAIICIADFAFI